MLPGGTGAISIGYWKTACVSTRAYFKKPTKMYDLSEKDKMLERSCGLISGYFIFGLHELSTAAGSKWDMNDPATIDIIVTKQNAEGIYALCKEIRSGYTVGLKRGWMKKIKEARLEAHKFLYEEANDPNTPIDRKIELVRLTSKYNRHDPDQSI